MRHEGRARQVRRCPACGQVQRLGFADETARQGLYGIAVAVVCPCRARALRKVLRSLVRPGVRRVHFSKQQDRDRREVLSRIRCEDFRALFVVSRGREPEARSACWAQLVPLLLDYDVAELAIERMHGARTATAGTSGTRWCVSIGRLTSLIATSNRPMMHFCGWPTSWRGLRERVASGERGSLRSWTAGRQREARPPHRPERSRAHFPS